MVAGAGHGVGASPYGSVMGERQVIESFWAAMQANDWTRAARCFVPNIVIDWPCSGEQIRGRDDFVTVQADYPSGSGRWTFDVHRIVADAGTVVSEVTVTDGEQSARVVTFSEIEDDTIVGHVEYWPTAYDPPPGRERLTHPGVRIP